MNKWRAMKRKHWYYLSQTGGLGTSLYLHETKFCVEDKEN